MSNERAVQITPFVSPDSIRKTLRFLKSYYDGYTKQNYGYIDMNGNPYVGTVRNFGSELFFEARKMLTNNIPIDTVIKPNACAFYFDITYSELVNTYDQQGLLVATLKPNVLLNNCEYRLIFNNCDIQYVLRSESWSDPDVYRDKFYVTTTPPILRITHEDNSVEDILMEVDSGGSVKYYYHDNKASSLYIDSYDDVNHVLTTKQITNRETNLPFIWFTTNILNVLPDIGFTNNLDTNNNPLLTVGTDGHNSSYLYLRIFDDSYPGAFDPEDGLKWWVIAHPVDMTTMDPKSRISNITFVRALTPWDEEPLCVVKIEYDMDKASIYLSDDVHWLFHDDSYAYIDYDAFIGNIPESETEVLVSGFSIIFNYDFMGAFESVIENCISGIHLDTYSAYNENGVIEKNGVTDMLCEFDGLPTYFDSLGDKTNYRSHIDLYAIRSRSSKTNQKVTDRQTAAIILDSGISQKDMGNLEEKLEVVMKYDYVIGRYYYTFRKPESIKNAKTSIVCVDDGHFGDQDTPGREKLPHLIFHGNRSYSCKVIDMDPNLNFARGCLVTNDPGTYENNASSPNVKPARTLARICDIPTVFSQIIHNTGVAPTFILDDKYIRSYASYNTMVGFNDVERLWNGLSEKWVTRVDPKCVCDLGIFDPCDLNIVLPTGYLLYQYYQYTNLNATVQYHDTELSVMDGGHGYSVGDTFSFYIGGMLIDGEVTSETDTVVTNVTLNILPNQVFNIGNFDGKNTTFNTETTSGGGNGLRITISILDVVWNDKTNHKSNRIRDGLFTLMRDEYGFIWLWRFDTDENIWVKCSQLTGANIEFNEYDFDKVQFNRRDLNSVMMYNEMNVSKFIKENELSHLYTWTESTDVSTSTPIEEVETFSNVNHQTTTYVLYNDGDATYKVDCSSYTSNTTDKHVFLLPNYNDVRISYYRCSASSLQMISNDSYEQPRMVYYNPIKDVIDNIEPVSSNMNEVTNRPMTVLDKIDGEKYVDKYGKLKNPLYVYDNDRMYGVRKLRDAGDVIVDKHTNLPVGEQPVGGYNILMDQYNPNGTYQGDTIKTSITYIFKINEDVNLNAFRMYNEFNEDISEHCLIIMNNKKYYFSSTSNVWIELQ